MKPRFALDLTEEAISLLSREGEAWQLVGRVALDGADTHRALTGLRQLARAYGDAFATKLVLPEAQILYFQIPDHGFDTASRRAQVLAALNGRTPYPVDDLVFDFAVRDGTIMVAAIAGVTLQEAEEFAEGYGFHPVCFVAAPGQDHFDGEPFFGLTRNSGKYLQAGARLERDALPIRNSQPQVQAASEVYDTPFIEVPEQAGLPEPEPEEALATQALDDALPDGDEAPEVEPELASDVPASDPAPAPQEVEQPEPEVPEPGEPEPQEPAPEEPEPDLPAEPEPEPAPEGPEPVEIPALPDEPEGPAPDDLPSEAPAPEDPAPAAPEPDAPAPRDPLPDAPLPELPGSDAPWPEDPAPDVTVVAAIVAEETEAGPAPEAPEPATADAEPLSPEEPADSDGETDLAPDVATIAAQAGDARSEEATLAETPSDQDDMSAAPALPGVTTDIPPAAFQSRRLVASADEPGAITRSLAPRLGGLVSAPDRAPIPSPAQAPSALLTGVTERLAHVAAISGATARNVAASAKAALGNGQRALGQTAAHIRPALQALAARTSQSGATLLQAARSQQKPLLIAAAGLCGLVLLVGIYSFWPASQPSASDAPALTQAAAPSGEAPAPETPPLPDAPLTDQAALDDAGDVTPPADEEPATAQEPAPAAANANSDGVPLAPYDLGTVESPASPEPVTDPFDYHVAGAAPSPTAAPAAAGLLMAGGFTLFEGKPDILPKPRPADLAQKALEARAPKPDPRVVGKKPKPRPADLVPPPAAATEGAAPEVQPMPAGQTLQAQPGQTPALATAAPVAPAALPADPKLAKFRPKARPAAVEKAAASQKAQTEAAAAALASATKLAVANSPRPEPKPVVSLQVEAAPTVLSAPSQAIDQSAVEAALAEAQTAEEVQAQPEVDAVPQVPVVPEPDNSGPVDEPELQNGVPNMPTTKTVAKKSTVKNAIDLGETNLIGVYGSDNSRRALVRLSSGRYVKVKIGDRLDGGRVVAIGDNQLSYEKKGRTIVLKMITKG